MALDSDFKLKRLNDPIYGFVPVEHPLLLKIIDHPFFQRLRRIYQMGMSYFVYPGAHHTRFEHALGSMFLAQKAIGVLRNKGVKITEQESLGLLVAMLLHDIGHGPFSHALEGKLVINTSHEKISMAFIEILNQEFGGQLDMAIQILENRYEKNFLCQLVSGQIDLDRLDYLKRDSFYTGIPEGDIHQDRIISMLNISKQGNLIFEEKAVYPIEHFLLARRFMYWQAYFHKINLLVEHLLRNIFKRVTEISVIYKDITANKSLNYFLEAPRTIAQKQTTIMFANLDDIDVFNAIKQWQFHEDIVLSSLSKMLVNRQLLKIEMFNEPFDINYIKTLKQNAIKKMKLTDTSLVAYFVFDNKIETFTYNRHSDNINIITKTGIIKDITEVTDDFSFEFLTKPTTKYFLCYPKEEDFMP